MKKDNKLSLRTHTSKSAEILAHAQKPVYTAQKNLKNRKQGFFWGGAGEVGYCWFF